MKTLFFFLTLLASVSVGAATCRYVKADGQVLYANVPIQNAKKGACFGAEDPAPEKPKAKNSSKNLTPADFPSIDSATQQARDSTRKQVLQGELEIERAALAKAKTNNKPEEVNLHNLNIQMLEKELASVR
jgi:hypothetical protein